MHCCIAYRPDIQVTIDKVESTDRRFANELNPQEMKALSVAFHETCHWWQHIGTAAGFIDGLGFAAQATRSIHLARKLARLGTLEKPLYQAARTAGTGEADVLLSQLVNGWMDIEYGHLILSTPEESEHLLKDRYFDSVGSSIGYLYNSVMGLLNETVGPQMSRTTPVDSWIMHFNQLAMIPGTAYHYQSERELARLGTKALMEGQAAFHQEQYLERARAASGSLRQRLRSVNPIYSRAFEIFLELAGLEWPESALAPVANTFLLTCDIALNPHAGHPRQPQDFAAFPHAVNPGIRFTTAAMIIAADPTIVDLVRDCSDAAYRAASERICRVLGWATPSEVACDVLDLFSDLAPAEKAEPQNAYVTFLCNAHREFMRERVAAPAWCCWPAQYLVYEEQHERDYLDAMKRWSKHHAPFFINSSRPETPFGTVAPSADEEFSEKLLESFISSYVLFDFMRQWVSADGPFETDYTWLAGREKMFWHEFVARIVQANIGVEIDQVPVR
jgi:hypothetical protein